MSCHSYRRRQQILPSLDRTKAPTIGRLPPAAVAAAGESSWPTRCARGRHPAFPATDCGHAKAPVSLVDFEGTSVVDDGEAKCRCPKPEWFAVGTDRDVGG